MMATADDISKVVDRLESIDVSLNRIAEAIETLAGEFSGQEPSAIRRLTSALDGIADVIERR